jgi:hypothetical protein
MKKHEEPTEPPPEGDSLERLADFTRRILRVPKSELQDKDDSGQTKIDEPSP